jgi:trk system potassium uptake protein TrkH
MTYPLFGRKNQPWQLTLHAKVALTVSGGLIVIGFLLILVLEFNEGLGHLPFSQKVLAAFFQSVTARTAGFSTITIATLAPATLLGIMILMFIGGSPGSTAGGIKTTTFGTTFATLVAILRGREQVEVFRRAIHPGVIHKALALSFLAFAFLNVSIFLLLVTQEGGFLELAFEATSAFGTVGLSTGYTPRLSPVGKGIIIITMLVGRIGPLGLASALAEQPAKGKYAYPTERLLIG